MTEKDFPWKGLLNEGRRKKESRGTGHEAAEANQTDARTEIERDFDRILFSTATRRLADKTQVFPLDKNDSVRTRLTHSHEVSNLARSIGTALAFNHGIAESIPNSKRNIPALLASVGLAHDLGNPPFGHQGEGAIQSWFSDHRESVLKELEDKPRSKQLREDFLRFEGNAQGFRLLTRLQLINDDYGLDLTHATLAALMKYPTPSDRIDKAHVAKKKHGFFASEQHVVEYVQKKVGTSIGVRHPLSYIMEACDDIAYVVLDAEDTVKKGLASFSDLIAFLEKATQKNDREAQNSTRQELDLVNNVIKESLAKHNEYRSTLKLSPSELNDVSMQRFRVFAIGAMVKAATHTFHQNEKDFVKGKVQNSLLDLSDAKLLRKALKDFSIMHAYTHRTVLEIELQGYNVLRGLMDFFWAAIVDRESEEEPGSMRKQPFTRFVYGRISENYRRIFENPSVSDKNLPVRYRECLLLTDMISGMTDSYAVNLYQELVSLQGNFDPKSVFSGVSK